MVTVSGSTVGVISTGDNAHISIGTQQLAALHNANEDDKATLQQLLEQLKAELAKVPAEQQAEVKPVVELTNGLIEQATTEQPNKTLLHITADGLVNATKAIASVIPLALPVATDIANLIKQLNP
jgi:succinate dehydrogenase/fumarate reductase flavoprotein subunit